MGHPCGQIAQLVEQRTEKVSNDFARLYLSVSSAIAYGSNPLSHIRRIMQETATKSSKSAQDRHGKPSRERQQRGREKGDIRAG